MPNLKDGPKLSFRTVKFTPDLASKWLVKYAEGAPNRPLSEAVIERYQREMEGGRWRETGEALIISSTNLLLDGRHRLTALSRCTPGTEIVLPVVYGVHPEAIHAIDTGRVRATWQILGLLGRSDPKRRTSVGRRVAVAFGMYDEGTNLSGDEVDAILAEHPGIEWVLGNTPKRGMGSICISPILAGFAIAWESKPELVETWYPKFLAGDLTAGQPLLALRNYLLLGGRAPVYANSTPPGRQALIRRTLTALDWTDRGLTMAKSVDNREGFTRFVGLSEE